MGIAFKELIEGKDISIEELSNKVIVIDAYNNLYQYLTTIRSRDGSPLMDSKGRITSHLVGLFSRTTKLMQYGIKPIFVFDGKAPELKQKERDRRKAIKLEAQKRYDEAAKKQDIGEMKKYASRTARLTAEMVEEAKQIVSALGVPVVQAPSEGEAQAAHMAKKGDAFAAVSQDYDSLLHGAPKLVRNLSISGKRKSAGKPFYEAIEPQLIMLGDNLSRLGIDQGQLIALAVLIGTDYNPGGIKGIGPKNALKLVKKHGSDFSALFSEAKWNDSFEFGWTEVYDLIKGMPTTDSYELKWGNIDKESLLKLLVDEYSFSGERVKSSLEKLENSQNCKKQKWLGEFFS